MPRKIPRKWEPDFPNLGKWTLKSRRTRHYNCFAFAAGDNTQRWEPYGYYWPQGATKGFTLDCFVEAYQTRGFAPCANGGLVAGREKIAIYLNKHGSVQHAARQLPEGRWVSKMGDEE